jgi:hypothetical protein
LRDEVALSCLVALVGCADTTRAPPPRTAPPPGGPPYAAPAPYGAPSPYPYGSPSLPPPPPYGPAPIPPPQQPPPARPAPPASAAQVRPLLGPLVGAPAWQAEARAIAKELVANLSAQNQSRVATIPLVFDPNPNEVNAFAGCDDAGAPFVAGTEGLLEAVDAIAQTKATDELYGTQTFETYVGIVAPRLVTKDGGSSLLPVGVIAPQYWLDVRRISRAHEVFDEIIAFTFGHELSHHYLGHTGCANGQAGTLGPAIAQLDQLATSVLPLVNQPNESMADLNGCLNVLDTGRARSSVAYAFTEQGGLWLLDFFARLDRASGANPWLGFLRTHPNPGLRIPLVQGTAATWRLRNPG